MDNNKSRNENRIEKDLKIISEKFKQAKEQGNHYIASYKHILDHEYAKDIINDVFIPSQNEWQIRNGAQYKFVKNQEQKRKSNKRKSERKSEPPEQFDFDFPLNSMFYEDFQDKKLKKFLIESDKTPINSEMAFISIKINNLNNYQYVLFIDNMTETLSLFRTKNIRYINDQSNLNQLLYNVLPPIKTAKSENFHNFLKMLTKELSKQLIGNENILNEIYKDTLNFYKDEQILKQFNSDIIN